jgi:hypothetical protein
LYIAGTSLRYIPYIKYQNVTKWSTWDWTTSFMVILFYWIMSYFDIQYSKEASILDNILGVYMLVFASADLVPEPPPLSTGQPSSQALAQSLIEISCKYY